jgi:hypothetical protein
LPQDVQDQFPKLFRELGQAGQRKTPWAHLSSLCQQRVLEKGQANCFAPVFVDSQQDVIAQFYACGFLARLKRDVQGITRFIIVEYWFRHG